MTRRALFGCLLLAVLSLLVFAACARDDDAESETYVRINALRTQAGLQPLAVDNDLARIARSHTEDMASRGHFGHDFADGCTVICVMDREGIPHAWAGENLEVNNYDWTETAARTIDKWTRSPEHLDIMMNCHYTRFGSGVTEGAGGRIYFSTIFEGDAPC